MRAREDELRPAAHVVGEHRHGDDGVGPLRERTHRGIGDRLLAGDDQQADAVERAGLALAGGRPGLRDRAAVRRRREVEGAAAVLLVEAAGVREAGELGAAVAARARPDDRRALGRVQPLAERSPPVGRARVRPRRRLPAAVGSCRQGRR